MATSLTNEEIGRYSRHLIMPEVGMEGQRRLKAAKVLCVGTGGLGSPLAFYLAAAGIGTLAQSILVGVEPVDPTAFGATALLFVIVLAIAAWTPAARAAATDPATALRAE